MGGKLRELLGISSISGAGKHYYLITPLPRQHEQKLSPCTLVALGHLSQGLLQPQANGTLGHHQSPVPQATSVRTCCSPSQPTRWAPSELHVLDHLASAHCSPGYLCLPEHHGTNMYLLQLQQLAKTTLKMQSTQRSLLYKFTPSRSGGIAVLSNSQKETQKDKKERRPRNVFQMRE